MRKSPKVSVIILNYNGSKFLKECLDSLRAQSYKDSEIIVVDNASTDDSLKILRKYKEVRIIQNTTNLGFAQGNNVGVDHAKGKYIVLLNNDIRAEKNWLGTLVHSIEKHKELAVVGSLGLDPKHSVEDIAFYTTHARTMGMNLCGELVSVAQSAKEKKSAEKQAFFVGGFALIYRKKDFPQPFDPSYFAYAEDVYLGWLCHFKGGKVCLNTSSRLIHYGGMTKGSSATLNKIAVFNGTKNQIMNFLLFYSPLNILRIGPLFVLTQIAHIIQDPRKLIVKCKAYFWVLINLFMIARKRNAIQAQRTVSDATLVRQMSCKFFDPFYLKSTWQIRAVAMTNSIFHAYCWIVRLKTREFSKT